MKVTTVAVDEIYPIVKKSLDKDITKYKKNIQQFFEARSEDLYDTAPYSRMPFGDKERDLFFKSIDVSKNEIRECLKDTYYWNMNFSPAAAKDEMTMTMMMIIRYFLLKNDTKNMELSAIYLAFSGKFYPSIHYGSYKVAQPSQYRHVMEYVVNNMLTMKFDLKREGSVFGAIKSICKTWLATYEDILRNPDDEENSELIKQLYGRIKSFMINIAKLYYDAYDNKLYITFDSDSTDEDSFRIADNDSLKSERYVENAMNFINNNNVDYILCKMASDQNVKINEVKSIIESIQDDKKSIAEIKELFRLIISDYIQNNPGKTVASIEFVSYSVKAKPNSKNNYVIRQKEIIEGWLDEKSAQYRKRKSRAATKSSYYNSVLTYYVLAINKSNK